MISSRQIFSCSILSVSSVFVSVACVFSLCSKAWSIFNMSLHFQACLRHQRWETSSPWCCRSKRAHVAVCTVARHATQISPPPSANTAGLHKLLSQITHLPRARSGCPTQSCSCAHTQIPPSICVFVLLLTSQQRSGLARGPVLPQSPPPAAQTRLDRSRADKKF